MAAYTQTITNSINCFGSSPPTVWGNSTVRVMTWGSSKWGEGTHSSILSVEKLVEDSIDSDDLVSLTTEFERLRTNEITCLSETTSEGLGSGNGYLYVFVKPTTEAEDRNQSSYSSLTAGSQTYTSMPAASTVWS